MGKERFEEIRKVCRFESVHLHLVNDSPAEAIYTAEALLKENPENETVIYELAFCYNLKNDTDSSIVFFTTII